MKQIKTALIIGATSGIGKELARLLVEDGYKVAITGRRQDFLLKIKEEHPDQYVIRTQDVTQIENNPVVFDDIVDELKTIDLIVYSSGTGGPNYELLWEQELPTLETNVMAATQIYGLSYRLFKKQGFGHLVGISSIASIRGNRHVPAYFASKAYQANYLESLWMKGKRSKAKIHVTDIQPGFVNTDMAIGDTFWMASVKKATAQIYSAIKRKKRKVYITKRWRIIALILKIVPARLLFKFS